MSTSKVTYLGDLRTQCVHIRSGNSYITDAPTDNHGKGEAFSPTDTVATGLANCMLTVMGIKARALQVKLDGSSALVTKIMASNPRRIARIELELHLPKQVGAKEKIILERTGIACPVNQSLHPDIERSIKFNWDI